MPVSGRWPTRCYIRRRLMVARTAMATPEVGTEKGVVLLSQKVAAESGENQLLGKIHASARGPNMDGRQISDDSESRFAAFVGGIVGVFGYADRAGPLPA